MMLCEIKPSDARSRVIDPDPSSFGHVGSRPAQRATSLSRTINQALALFQSDSTVRNETPNASATCSLV